MNTPQSLYSNVANAQNNSAATDNANISSVLSQIQDDGPAYADMQANVKRRDNLINISPDETSRPSAKQQSAAPVRDQKQTVPSAASINRGVRSHAVKGPGNKTSGWLQPAGIIFIALMIMFFLFRLDARTNQLEVSLSSLDDDVLDSIDTYSSELSPGFRSIKKTLKAVKQELERIKPSTQSELKTGKPAESQTADSEQLMQLSINDNIGIMEDEILALKDELKITKDQLEAMNVGNRKNKNTQADNNARADKNTANVSIVSTTGWVVNLASFTNISQAEKALQPLYAAGLFPLVQEVNVNGKRVYRLIVDGFSSQADAKMFVRRADDEFDLQGGWIRKS